MVLFFVVCVWAGNYNLIVHHKAGVDAYPIENVDSVILRDDTLSISNVFKRYSFSEIDSLGYNYDILDDTIRILWTEDNVCIKNPRADIFSVKAIYGDVEISSERDVELILLLEGKCESGSLRINCKSSVKITSNSLFLKSQGKEAINVQSKKKTTFYCKKKTIISDGEQRANDGDVCNSCIYTQGDLKIVGIDTLKVAGNYKHAIQSSKEISFNANVVIPSAVGSGIKAKKLMTVDGGSLSIEDIGNNGIDVEKGDFVFKDGEINVHLENNDTKGIKADSLYTQIGGLLTLDISGNQCKGIKTKKGIQVIGGEVKGYAVGGVVITAGDPSYCTFMKCEGDIVLDSARIELIHDGDGGKCISADGNLKFTDTSLTSKLTGNGGWYINENGEDDYYTPRAIEANDSLSIISGNIDIHCTGIGGKGIVCDHDLTIGELNGDNNNLNINIVTEGSSIVNDTIEDFRKGCPKAIKSGNQLDILSGNIQVKTYGMGGEGLESKNEVYIMGGNIALETFDDGINGGNSINVYGGSLYCCSQDNDGLDSNGRINILGGNIFSVSLHPQNESFDTEGNTLNVYGGTLLGIGGGTVDPKTSLIPYYSYPKWTSDIIQKPMPEINLHKGCRLNIMQGDRCLITGEIPADLTGAIITVASEALNKGQEYSVCETSGTTNTLLFTFNPRYYYPNYN